MRQAWKWLPFWLLLFSGLCFTWAAVFDEHKHSAIVMTAVAAGIAFGLLPSRMPGRKP